MKNILYVSTVCSQKKFEKIYEESIVKPQQQSQKFHSLFLQGLAQLNHNLYVMSTLPINSKSNREAWTRKSRELEGNIHYTYLPYFRFSLIKHLVVFISAFITCFVWSMKKSNKVLICDVLNLTSSMAALFVSKLFRYKSVAIVTDLPLYLSQYSRGDKKSKSLITNCYASLCNYFISKYDMYMILTEQMNEVVNPLNKPYVVIEGMVDLNMAHKFNNLENKYEEKVIIYAGALFEKYGVKKLIEAFINTSAVDARLWLYGAGEMEKEIMMYQKKDKRIRYFGVVPNTQVVQEEIRATLLVNPRPSTEEFTKYSFPSKNMEYMVSGTPLLTTKLPGMTEDYYDYVYLIENESVEDITEAIEELLMKSNEELNLKGYLAKEFVLKEKNNLVQAKKLLEKIT